jgi:2'-5' RNA ligase
VTGAERPIRAFVALDLPPDVRAALPRPPEPWRPVREEALHVTLAFLGSVDPAVVPAVAAAIDGVARELEPLRLVRLLALPKRRPRVLAAELDDPSGASIELQRELAAALAEAGVYEPEHRRWLPHVTIGRIKGPVDAAAPLPAVEPLSFVPPAITLYRSHLGRGPAVYEPLHTRRTSTST